MPCGQAAGGRGLHPSPQGCALRERVPQEASLVLEIPSWAHPDPGRKEEGRKGEGGPCPPVRVREGRAHLGEQVAAQLGVSRRAPRHMGQEGDEPLDLVQHSIGVGQGPLVLQPGEPPGPQHTVQLCLHLACR